MGLLARYDPPAHLSDFDAIDGQREAWHLFIQQGMQERVSHLQSDMAATATAPAGVPQFYDPSTLDVGPSIEQEIVWNAFPKALLRRFGRTDALRIADSLWPMPAYQMDWHYDPERALPDRARLERMGVTYPGDVLYRPQDEYCEWHVHRHEDGRMRRVTFTCEPPEYWQSLFGGRLDSFQTTPFPGSRKLALELYRRLVDERVNPDDLLATTTWDSPFGKVSKGHYDPWNRWNTTDGIAHLSAPPNALIAELHLAAHATRLFANTRRELVVRPDVLLAGSELGEPNRNSDTAIAGTINALARQGRRITLANPVGLYMDHIDLAGWETPDGVRPEDCVRVLRGSGRSIERLVVEMPPGHDLSELRIAGIPVDWGGQIAECITVKLTGVASLACDVVNAAIPMPTASYMQPSGGTEVFVCARLASPAGTVQAFVEEAGPHHRPCRPEVDQPRKRQGARR